MFEYKRVRGSVKPDPMVIDDYSVWIHSNIQEITENEGTENEFHGYEYDCIQYDKNEYIAKQSQDNAALEQKIIDTEVALCEVYELFA